MPDTPTRTNAVWIHRHGGPEVLELAEHDLAEVGPSDVLVEVDTASVSRWDLKYRTGLPQSMQIPGRALFPLPQQLGREASGEVLAVGAAVEGLRPGDHVVAAVHPENPLSVEAARGQGNLSSGVALPGHQSLGSYAQHLVRDESMWFKISPSVDLEQAAVTLWPFATAHRVLRDRLRVDLGDLVLVLGASGGMGQATLQLARMMGARPIAVTRDRRKVGSLEALGAEEVVVVSSAEAAGPEVSAAVGAPLDHVVDYVGDHALIRSLLGALRPGASICFSTGEQDPRPFPLTGADFVRLEVNALGVRGARRHDALVVLDLLERGKISTAVLASFPLSEAGEAHRLLESGSERLGRIILKPWPG